MKSKLRIGILGSGSWATAITKIITENNQKVNWYIKSSAIIEGIKKKYHNPNYLSSVYLKVNKIKIHNDINTTILASDILIFVIPSPFLNNELKKIKVSLKEKVILLSIKGIIPESKLIAVKHFENNYNILPSNIGVIAGPCHAEGIALKKMSYLTIASKNKKLAKELSEFLKNDYVRIKISTDIYGAEYAAILKNIYALGAGIASGLGYGDNFQSVFISNAIKEMEGFINNVCNLKRNISDSVYLGDLLVTAYSSFSRNRIFGNMIAKGYSPKSAELEMGMVAEGYYAVKSAIEIKNEIKIKIPIIKTIYEILYERKNPSDMLKKLSKKIS